MIVTSKFLHYENWSILATLRTIIILSIISLGIDINNINVLVFSSILAFMDGKILPKLIYTLFLCILIWNQKGIHFFKYTLLTLVACLIAHQFKETNIIFKLFYNNKFLKYLLIFAIILWIFYIPYLLYKKLKLKSLFKYNLN